MNSRKDEIARKKECGERRKKKVGANRDGNSGLIIHSYFHGRNVKP